MLFQPVDWTHQSIKFNHNQYNARNCEIICSIPFQSGGRKMIDQKIFCIHLVSQCVDWLAHGAPFKRWLNVVLLSPFSQFKSNSNPNQQSVNSWWTFSCNMPHDKNAHFWFNSFVSAHIYLSLIPMRCSYFPLTIQITNASVYILNSLQRQQTNTMETLINAAMEWCVRTQHRMAVCVRANFTLLYFDCAKKRDRIE